MPQFSITSTQNAAQAQEPFKEMTPGESDNYRHATDSAMPPKQDGTLQTAQKKRGRPAGSGKKQQLAAAADGQPQDNPTAGSTTSKVAPVEYQPEQTHQSNPVFGNLPADSPILRHRGRPLKRTPEDSDSTTQNPAGTDTNATAQQPAQNSDNQHTAPAQQFERTAQAPANQQPMRKAITFHSARFVPRQAQQQMPRRPEQPRENQQQQNAQRNNLPQNYQQNPQRNRTQFGNTPGAQQNSKWNRDKNNRRKQDYGYPHTDANSNDCDAYMDADADLGDRQIIDLMELQNLNINALTRKANELNLEGVGSMSRHELLTEVIKVLAYQQNAILRGGGTLEVLPDGHGFLRSSRFSYLPCPEDIFVHQSIIRKWSMRTGDTVVGQVRNPREKERYFVLNRVDTINDDLPEHKRETVPFENLTPYFPTQRIILEHEQKELSTRAIDLITPIGRGQRGLIVAAPRTGKTVIMQKIANAIVANNPDISLIVLLIDERPEEVTDMKREVKGEVVSSTFDEPPDRHVQVAEMVIEKAKRQVEHGKHVVILLDSITRLARAYNTIEPHSGRVLTGGVDANALHKPKRFFGAARNIENGGSLTILATALVETGSRMDDVIFEEFKGTGNMELNLDRHLAEKRVYPAINLEKSGTRREELLVHPDELPLMWNFRKLILALPPQDAMEAFLGKLKEMPDNINFLMKFKNINMDEVAGKTIQLMEN